MEREEIIDRFCQMGAWIEQGLETEEFDAVIAKAYAENGWFCAPFVRSALGALCLWLKKSVLEGFTAKYPFADKPKKVAVIAAGNLPAVAFHDIMCVILSGNTALVKLSSKDSVLLPFLFGKYFADRAMFTTQLLSGFDAVIATGSDNSSLYFQTYFSKYPNIIRHGRSSIAVLSGKESEPQLTALANDILLYAGLGCRSVSKVFVPKGYDFAALKSAVQSYAWLCDLNKYRNNLDYHRAIFVMNNLPFVDLGCVLAVESKALSSGVSVLNFEYYDNAQSVKHYIDTNAEHLQVVLSSVDDIQGLDFGTAQTPSIDDYADGVDTMQMLSTL